jgi:hypothetical protein
MVARLINGRVSNLTIAELQDDLCRKQAKMGMIVKYSDWKSIAGPDAEIAQYVT